MARRIEANLAPMPPVQREVRLMEMQRLVSGGWEAANRGWAKWS